MAGRTFCYRNIQKEIGGKGTGILEWCFLPGNLCLYGECQAGIILHEDDITDFCLRMKIYPRRSYGQRRMLQYHVSSIRFSSVRDVMHLPCLQICVFSYNFQPVRDAMRLILTARITGKRGFVSLPLRDRKNACCWGRINLFSFLLRGRKNVCRAHAEGAECALSFPTGKAGRRGAPQDRLSLAARNICVKTGESFHGGSRR